MTEGNGVDNRTTVGSAAYTFFLNLVVLDHQVPTGPASPEKPPSLLENEATAAPEQAAPEQAPEQAPVKEESPPAKEETPPPTPPSPEAEKKKGNKFHLDRSKFGLDKSKFNLDKSLHGFSKAMSKTSLAINKRSQKMGQKAAAYVANKTMVSRASSALTKSLGELSSEHLEMVIGKRFQQGSVIVLQVHLKPADLPGYIAEVRGSDAADQYRDAVENLKALGAVESMGSLERELLPQIRQGLMEKLSDKLVQAMKQKDNSLALECIALEENEEANWLFTFMEFQMQMKNETK